MSASLASAIELSLNQSRFIPGETLGLTLNEDWSGEADIYVAVTIPGSDIFYFLTPPLNFGLDMVPYAQAAQASGSSEILRMDLPAGLPTGEYTFYAGAVRVTGFLDEIIGSVVETSFIFATEAEPVDLTFGDSRLPDGVIERTYSFAIEPATGMPPYQFSLSTGTLPDGLTLGSDSGLIQGSPTQRGMSQFTVQVVDASGNVGEIERAIKVFGILSFGEHGTYKGCNGLQMAFNSAQDLDEIRIEQGTYECNGQSIPSSKTFEYGIKVSGGWDSGFVNQSDDPAVTVFDGGAKMIEGIENSEQCKEAGGLWYNRLVCFQEGPPSSSIFSVSADGSVAVEGLSFQNASARAISGNGKVNITHCVFTDNGGGAVSGADTITNSTFTNNSASGNGGAVYSSSSYSSFSITNSTFTKNTASGWTISGKNCTIVNSTIANNSGGGFKGSGTILNTIFSQNKVGEEANDIIQSGDLHVDYTLVNYISGAVDLGTHIIMGEPRFVDADNGNFRLRADSPAIDVGDSSVIESYRFLKDDNDNALDLEGNPRVVGGAIDLGAYEVQ